MHSYNKHTSEHLELYPTTGEQASLNVPILYLFRCLPSTHFYNLFMCALSKLN